MKRSICMLALLVLLVPLAAWGTSMSELILTDGIGGTAIVTVSTDSAGAVTISGATSVDFGASDLSTTGTLTHSGGTPAWSLDTSQMFDDGVTDSPYIGWKDATDNYGWFYKANGGNTIFYNDAAAQGISFMTGGDINDYVTITTSSNVPAITAVGDCDLVLATGASNYVDISTGSLLLADNEYITNASDVVTIYSDDNIATLTVMGYEDKASVLRLTADQGDDISDIWAITSADSATATLTIANDNAVKGTLATVFTLAATGDIIMAGTTPYLTIGDAGAEDAGITFDGHSGGTDWFITSDDSADDLVIGTAAPASATNVMYFTTDYHAVICNGDSTANAVEDVLTILKETSGTAAAGIGAAISFEIEDETTAAEQQASIDIVLTDATTTAEDADVVIYQNTAGAIAETLRLIAAASATTGDSMKFISNTTETDGILDILSLTTSAVTGAAGMGLGITWDYCDAGGAEEQGSIDNVLTTATNGSEMSDFVFSHQTAGAVAETLRLVGASSGTTADYLQWTANTTETNGIVDVLVLRMATGTATDNIGMSISFQPEDATGAEEHATMEIQLTDGTRATADADIFFTQDVAGTLETRVLFDADGPTVSAVGTTPYINIGDGGDEDAYLVLNAQGTDDWHFGFDTTSDDLLIGYGLAVGTTPRMQFADDSETITIGSTATDDTVLIFNSDAGGVTFYVANDNNVDELVIGAGSVVATTPAITVAGSTQVVTLAKTAVFAGGQTKREIIPLTDVILDSTAPPSLTYNGTAGQSQIGSLEFDATGATGDDICFIQWMAPAGYVVDSARLNVYWSFDTAETNGDDVVFDMAVNAAAAGETLDAAGTAFTEGDTNIADGSINGKLIKTTLNFEVEDIAIGDMVTIMFWIDENVSDLDSSGTCDVHMFEITYESTE